MPLYKNEMKRSKHWASLFLTLHFPLFAFGLAPLALFFFSYASYAKPADRENIIKLSQDHIRNLGVAVGKLTPVNQVPVLSAPAKVVIPPAHEYLVSASQAGLITRLNVSIGDKVNKGNVLAEINSPDLLSMQRLYLKAVSELRLGLNSYQRDKKLFDEGIIPDRRWQETRSRYEAFASEADEHRQLLKIAGMSDAEIGRLKKTHRLSGQLNVYSPIAGTVIDRMAVSGSRVDMLAPLYRIADLDELWLEINIPHERVAHVNVGDKVLIEDAYRDNAKRLHKDPVPENVNAKISLIGESVNPENQTVLARAVIIGKQTVIRPGQRINTEIIHDSGRPAYKIPNGAIAQNEGKTFVFIRSPDGFQVISVEVIGKQGDDAIITGAFNGNETIAVKGAVALKANWLGLGSEE